MVNYQKHQPSNLTSIIRLYLPRSGGEGAQFSVIVVSSAEKEKKNKPTKFKRTTKNRLLQNKHIPHCVVYFLCPTGASIPTEMRDK